MAATQVRSGSHRRLRGSIWWYRRDVPKDVRKLFTWPSANGDRHVTAVWGSLHTTDENEAKRLEKIKDVEFERRLREVRESADPEMRRHRVAERIVGDGRLHFDPKTLGFESQFMAVRSRAEFEGLVAPEDREPVTDLIARSVAERVDAQTDHLAAIYVLNDILQSVPSENRERCHADILGILRHYVSPTSTPPAITEPKLCLWSTIFDSWEAEMRPTPKTVYSWKRIIRKLVAHLVSKSDLAVDDAMAWNAAALTEAELIGWKRAMVSKIGPTTIKNHLTILRTLYNHAADNKLLPPGVTEGVRRVKHKAKQRPGTKRLGYTDDEARKILLAARRETDPVRRWAPWLAAGLGSRIDEVCGAMVPDIEIEHDAVWFNIRLDYREMDPDQDAEIKTENAERKVPIPPALWRDEGFVDYVVGLPKNGPLFPGLKPDMFGRRGGNGSKRVSRWVRGTVGITDPRKAPSHSWRHRFRTIVRNTKYGIGEDVADYMCGHGGNGGEGRSYGEYRDAMIVAIGRLPPPLPAEQQLAA
ncbi:MAG: DUF6538 domain-containing protein [Stellaceae bacterium]